MKVISHSSGAAVPPDGKSKRNAAPVESDTPNAPLGKESEHPSRTTAYIQHERLQVETLNQINERGRHDRANFFRRVRRNPVKRMLIVKCLLLSCCHFSIPSLWRSTLPSVRSSDPSPVLQQRPSSLAGIFCTWTHPRSACRLPLPAASARAR